MKKSILLFSACLVAGLANAQLANQSVLFGRTTARINKTQRIEAPKPAGAAKSTASATDRWYNYGGDLLYRELGAATSGLDQYGEIAPYIWFDTSSRDIYGATGGGTTLDYNILVGCGEVLQPWASAFNDVSIYQGGIVAVRATNAYQVDSIEVVGHYYRNKITTQTPYCAGCVDTLRVSWTVGTGGATGDITKGSWAAPIGPLAVGTLDRLDVVNDSANNCIKFSNHIDVPLYATDLIDTDVTYRGGSLAYVGAFHRRIGIPTLSVPAGQYVAASIAFKSGNPAAPHMPPGTPNFGDTVWTSNTTPFNNPVRWSLFRPLVGYRTTTSGSINPDWPQNPYDGTDKNAGFYRNSGAPTWGGKYINMWAFHGTTSADPSEYQHPLVGFHVTCSTCDTVGLVSLGVNQVTDLSKVAAVPNPANGQVSIFFTQANGVTATVALTNMLGQQVASQTISNGKAVFNTSALPAGVYNYSVKADGQSATGRVVVAH